MLLQKLCLNVHETAGKGSVGQPARIEAFWPSRPPAQEPSRPPHPRPAPAPRRQKLSKQQLSKGSPKTEGYSSATVRLSEEGSDVIGLHELGRPLNHKSRGSPSGVDVAGRELTKHLEYDILQCMAKNRPEVWSHCGNHTSATAQGSSTCASHRCFSSYSKVCLHESYAAAIELVAKNE